MSLLVTRSLGETLNNVHDACFFSRRTTAAQRKEAAEWIASRHGQAGAYANTFALLPAERRDGIRLFTGERVTSAAARHIAGQEACRALRLLEVKAPKVRQALDIAAGSLHQCVGPLDRKADPERWSAPFQGGVYCCGQCSAALWRHILAGGWDHPEQRLSRGLKYLRNCRKGDGAWRIFPYWYTMLALSEMPLPEAAAEIEYGRAKLERAAALNPRDTESSTRHRRTEVARRALNRLR